MYTEIKCNCKGCSHVCVELQGLVRFSTLRTNNYKVFWYKSTNGKGYLVSETRLIDKRGN